MGVGCTERGIMLGVAPPLCPPAPLLLTEVTLAEVPDALGASLGWTAPPASPCRDKGWNVAPKPSLGTRKERGALLGSSTQPRVWEDVGGHLQQL